jgi:hypothetical protein
MKIIFLNVHDGSNNTDIAQSCFYVRSVKENGDMIQQLLDLRELISTKIKTCLHKLKFVL